jgi:hypothetical protein
MAKTTKKIIRYRDAETGEYTTKKKAEQKPKTTVKETDKIVVKPKTTKKR